MEFRQAETVFDELYVGIIIETRGLSNGLFSINKRSHQKTNKRTRHLRKESLCFKIEGNCIR